MLVLELARVIAGLRQHGSEARRYFWKWANLGRLYNGGLFRYARFINHTGHLLRDVCALLFGPANLFFWYCNFSFLLTRLQKVMREGVVHLWSQYGDSYVEYERRVPWLLIPRVY